MIAYILLCGYPPFYGKTDKDIFASVRQGQYDFPGPEWDTVSDAAKEFIGKLLVLDPGERPSAREARADACEADGRRDGREGGREGRGCLVIAVGSARTKRCFRVVGLN